MKLFVDDIRNAPDESWAVARTVDSAIAFIAHFGIEIEEISLDHDISHQVAMGERSSPYPCAETFTAVARYVVEYYTRELAGRKPKVTIHTSNPAGAVKMKEILKDFPAVEIRPYGAANRLEQIV